MGRGAPPWKVLIADDSASIRDLLRYNLEADGRFSVIAEAEDGERAVRMASDLQPDAVVLDVAMPAMSGLDALPLIRRAISEDVVVVMLSALDPRTTAAQAQEVGALFIPKLEASALPRRLASLCAKASAGRG
jgi:chemotaxis response regulator CheB